MTREHCHSADSCIEFAAANYGTTTRSDWEYAFVVAPETGPPAECGETWPLESKLRADPQLHGRCRVARSLAEFEDPMRVRNEQLAKQQCKPILLCEFHAARLYTGPLFVKYNLILRGLGTRIPFFVKQLEATCLGNTYTTTLHIINSACVKLSKLTKVQRVYRGVAGGTLPPTFWHKNEWNVAGGVETSFMSTTLDRSVAVHYAGGDAAAEGAEGGDAPSAGAALVFEIQMGMINRGADLSWLSQYPHEAEILFAPLTGVEVTGTRVEGGVIVVELAVDINLSARTIEQVVSLRRRLCSDMCDSLLVELGSATRGSDWLPLQHFEAAAVLPVRTYALDMLRERLTEVSSHPPEHYNDDRKLLNAFADAINASTTIKAWPSGWRRLVAGALKGAERRVEQLEREAKQVPPEKAVPQETAPTAGAPPPPWPFVSHADGPGPAEPFVSYTDYAPSLPALHSPLSPASSPPLPSPTPPPWPFVSHADGPSPSEPFVSYADYAPTASAVEPPTAAEKAKAAREEHAALAAAVPGMAAVPAAAARLWKDEEVAAHVAAALGRLTAVEVLSADKAELRAGGAGALGLLIRWSRRLQSVRACGEEIDPEGAIAIGRSLGTTATLTELDLSSNKLCGLEDAEVAPQRHGRYRSAPFATAFCDGLAANSSLEKLNLNYTILGDQGCKALCRAIQGHPTLTDLDIGSNAIGVGGWIAVTKLLAGTENDVGEACKLQLLNLESNVEHLAPKEKVVVCQLFASAVSARNRSLRELNLESNEFGRAAGAQLAPLLAHPTLTSLNLSMCEAGEGFGLALGPLLGSNSTLSVLKLDMNKLGAAGGVGIAAGLGLNASLTELDLNDNGLDASVGPALCVSLTANASITKLNLGCKLGCTHTRNYTCTSPCACVCSPHAHGPHGTGTTRCAAAAWPSARRCASTRR